MLPSSKVIVSKELNKAKTVDWTHQINTFMFDQIENDLQDAQKLPDFFYSSIIHGANPPPVRGKRCQVTQITDVKRFSTGARRG